MGKAKLTEAQAAAIEAVVREAEGKTSAEIAGAMIKESSDYARHELLGAIIVGLFFFTGVTVFTPSLESWIQTLTWSYSSLLLVGAAGFSTFLVIGIAYFLANLAPIDRWIVPRRVMNEEVRRRAIRHFLESGVHRTRERNGLLIFVSLLERRIEIVADIGIADKVPPETWEAVVAGMRESLRSGDTAEALARAVSQCGDILAGHFPPRPDDINELSNKVQILRDDS